MSDQISNDEDISVTHEYLIAGTVIILFGLLYWFLSGNFNNSFQNNSIKTSIPLVAENTSADHKTPRKGLPLTQVVGATSANASMPSKAPALEAKSPDANLSATSEVVPPETNIEESTATFASADMAVNNGLDGKLDTNISSVTQEQKELNKPLPTDNTKTTEVVDSLPEKSEETSVDVDNNKVTEATTVAKLANNLSEPEEKTESQPENKEVVPTYSLPDGTPIKISADGFEGDLQQLFQNGELNKPLTFDQIYFDTGSTKINAKSDRQIRVTAALMNAFPKINILLRGHTDNRGAPTDNFQLSLMRANSMGLALGTLGIDTERIRVLGMGDGFPVASNNTEKGRKKNRRIEILLQ